MMGVLFSLQYVICSPSPICFPRSSILTSNHPSNRDLEMKKINQKHELSDQGLLSYRSMISYNRELNVH